jgi:hypothetical protein
MIGKVVSLSYELLHVVLAITYRPLDLLHESHCCGIWNWTSMVYLVGNEQKYGHGR